MPSKKKKYNARFPAGRIKKIMQTDEEVGKVAQAVPVIISRTLELFVESLLTKSMLITQSRNAKTLTPSHMKQCILSESRFDFLKDLVKNIPDASVQEDNDNNANDSFDYTNYSKSEEEASIKDLSSSNQKQEIVANFYTEQSTSASRAPVIQYGPTITNSESKKGSNRTTEPSLKYSIDNLCKSNIEPKIHINVASFSTDPQITPNAPSPIINTTPPPPLIPISQNYYAQNSGDNLYIDEDYDN